MCAQGSWALCAVIQNNICHFLFFTEEISIPCALKYKLGSRITGVVYKTGVIKLNKGTGEQGGKSLSDWELYFTKRQTSYQITETAFFPIKLSGKTIKECISNGKMKRFSITCSLLPLIVRLLIAQAASFFVWKSPWKMDKKGT